MDHIRSCVRAQATWKNKQRNIKDGLTWQDRVLTPTWSSRILATLFCFDLMPKQIEECEWNESVAQIKQISIKQLAKSQKQQVSSCLSRLRPHQHLVKSLVYFTFLAFVAISMYVNSILRFTLNWEYCTKYDCTRWQKLEAKGECSEWVWRRVKICFSITDFLQIRFYFAMFRIWVTLEVMETQAMWKKRSSASLLMGTCSLKHLWKVSCLQQPSWVHPFHRGSPSPGVDIWRETERLWYPVSSTGRD